MTLDNIFVLYTSLLLVYIAWGQIVKLLLLNLRKTSNLTFIY